MVDFMWKYVHLSRELYMHSHDSAYAYLFKWLGKIH
jgi:hypothetical protein